MKNRLNVILTTLIACFTIINAQAHNIVTTLYPIEATATKYGKTIRIPDLSGLPLFSATYDHNANNVIVRRGDRKLTLIQSNKNYYKSGKYGSLQYSMEASVYNGIVSQIIYLETEDNITVKIIYRNKN